MTIVASINRALINVLAPSPSAWLVSYVAAAAEGTEGVDAHPVDVAVVKSNLAALVNVVTRCPARPGPASQAAALKRPDRIGARRLSMTAVAVGQALIHIATVRAVGALPPVRTTAHERTKCVAADRVGIAVMITALTFVDVAA